MILLLALLLQAPEAAELHPLADRWVAVRLVDGRIVHHGFGQKRSDEQVLVARLPEAALSKPESWSLGALGAPARVARKTRGIDFAWKMEGWKDGRAVNTTPDHVKEHWIYLELPAPLRRGTTYTVSAPGLVPELKLAFDERRSRSEALHVNLVGYPASSPAKYGYLYLWMGDAGGLDVKPLVGRPFELLEQPGGASRFSGTLALRGSKDRPETGQLKDTPGGHYLGADVLEADFSAFDRPGTYVLSVPGVGCSFPFAVGDDALRPAFVTTARGLYHNRSGLALRKPYTEFERPAPHHPALTPGFAGKLVYTKSRFVDWKNGDHDAADKPAIEKGIVGPLDAWGWYQDAGDWDSYLSHLNVASCLLLAWELKPENFRDGELNLPESGNGMPDILDEAAWLPRFCKRLRAELVARGYGSGGIGLRVCGDHFGGDGEGVPSWKDVNRTWIVSGEDPWSTYTYAAVAARLAWALRKLGVADPEKADWAREAVESWKWAAAHTGPEDEKGRPSSGGPIRDVRAYAAAALFRLTGEAEYQTKLTEDTAGIKADSELHYGARWAPWIHVLKGGTGAYDAALVERLRTAVLRNAERLVLESASKRSLRWGGNWWMPMMVGQQTTPDVLEGMVGHALVKDADPAKARTFAGAVATSADYVLGTNALNMTWVTGLGPRHPKHVFHMDAWYNGKGVLHPGIIPYGPWKKVKDAGIGPWDGDWANASVHPGIDAWPGNERWFENRCCPLGAEFTVHQTVCTAAAVFGWLCGPAGGSGDGR
jgi:hypothetical protein